MALIETNIERIGNIAMQMAALAIVYKGINNCIGRKRSMFCDSDCLNCLFPELVTKIAGNKLIVEMQATFRHP